MTKKMTADEILVNMYKMDDTEKLELLKVLSEKHFEGTKSVEEIRHLNSIAVFGDEEEDNNDQKTCEEMIKYMKHMENSERFRLLDYLFHNHSDSKRPVGVSAPTKAYIEGYLERKLTIDEIVILKLAYDWGHFVGEERGMKQV
ncbi:TPA: hypothetical protein ACOQ39_004093 [Bacillus cereus]|uniref:hypothetical protein n=1 Tax=Bacillus TaxID=1386 RepID=UPI00122F4C6A|nr:MULTISPECIES: hypothetical protein [Bacillus]HDR7980570.1 hypothetical protein [Bacillus cereus]MBJ7947135.1 hypothetical protein [Bacillus cereus group sp. N24]QEQ16303.1 hypothetical protein F0362_06535 [Bacillus sp. BS98]HDR8058521.1 hypothetical protein [Bacillus cereus]HDR8219335.1 hypothetical protein [Bacillus cereus]